MNLGIIWERVIKNWKTSVTAIIAMIVVVAGWFGFKVSGEEVLTVIIGFQMLVLLFAKD